MHQIIFKIDKDTTELTLTKSTDAVHILVFANGLLMTPFGEYQVEGNLLKFTAPVVVGYIIQVAFM